MYHPLHSDRMDRQRLFYVDALKAFAILSVIIGHLAIYKIWNNDDNSISTFVNWYHMPLFMLLSGFVTKIDKFSMISRIKILIPFFVFGTLFTLMCNNTLIGFITSEPKYGYWFLYVIVVFFFFLHLIRVSKINRYLGAVGIQILFMVLHFSCRRTMLGTTLSTDHLWALWPYFSLGFLFQDRLYGWISKHKRKVFITSFFLIGILIWFNYHITSDAVLKLLSAFYGFPSCAFLLVIFIYMEQIFKNKKSKIKDIVMKTGQEIGTNTLQIYALHYFFIQIIDLSFLRQILIQKDILFLEYLIQLIITIIIAYACIYTARLLYRLHLGFLFGR